MAKRLNRPARILLIVCAVLVGIVMAVQIVLNSPVVRNTVDKYAAEFVDGSLSYDDIDFSVFGAFPKLRLTVDSLSLTYPHGRFGEWPVIDSLSLAGQGEEADTLLAFDRLSLTVAPFRLLFGKLVFNRCALHGLSAYAHVYPDSSANWQILHFPSDTAKKGSGMMPVSIKDFRIDRRPSIVLTDDISKSYMDLGLSSLAFSGTVASKDGFSLRNGSIFLSAFVRTSFGNYHNLTVPLQLDARASVSNAGDSLSVRIPDLAARVAHIPLNFSGRVRFGDGRTFVSGKGSIDSLNISTILRQYGTAVSPVVPYFSTDSKLNLKFSANGWYEDDRIPDIRAKLSIPESSLCYVPRDMNGRVAVECNLNTRDNKLDATFDRLFLSIPGISVNMTGIADDLLSGNPAIKANLTANTVLDYLTKYLLHDGGIDAFGKMDVVLSANTHLRDLQTMNFDNSALTGRISGDRVKLLMPASSFKLNAYRSNITLTSNPKGIGMGITMDSAYFYSPLKDKNLSARVKNCLIKSEMSTKMIGDTYVPSTSMKITARSAFVRTEGLKASLNGTDAYLECLKKLNTHRPRIPDTLRLVDFTGKLPPLDSTGRPVPPEDDRIIKMRLDSLLVAELFTNWSSGGTVSVDNGAVATPVFPLRSRIGKIRFTYDENRLNLDTLALRAGTSDMSFKGSVNGIKKFAKHKGPLSVNMDINSNRVNVNELVSAIQSGNKMAVDTTLSAEADVSFLQEDLADKHPEKKSGKKKSFMLPSDIIGTVNVNLRKVNYLDLNLTPMTAQVNLHDRVLQLKDARTDLGFAEVGAKGYYSTRSAKDISIGVDAYVRDASINPVMRLFPGYDDFAPIAKSIDGVIGMEACVVAGLDKQMNVKPSTVNGTARINGEDIFIRDVGSLRGLTRLLFFNNKDIGHIDDFHIDAIAQDGKLEVFPFIIKADKYKVALQGIQGLDGTMNYYASVLKSPFLIPFGVKVYGNFKKCKVGLGIARYLKKDVPVFTTQVDSMHLNIAKAIDQVYKDGVESVLRYNRRNSRSIEAYKRFVGYRQSEDAGAVSNMQSDRLTSSGKTAGTDDKSSTRLDTKMLEQEFKRIRDEFRQKKQKKNDGKH